MDASSPRLSGSALLASFTLLAACADVGTELGGAESSRPDEGGTCETDGGDDGSTGATGDDASTHDTGSTGDTGTSVAVRFELESVQYAMDWADIEPPSSGAEPLMIVSDLGYRVRIDAAFLTLRGMSLVACSDADQAGGLDALALAGPDGLRGDGAANDPTAVYHGYVEDLSLRELTDFGDRDFDAVETCGVHFVHGQAPATALNLPSGADDPDMRSRTLWIEGAYAPPGSDSFAPLALDLNFADGLVTAWDDAQIDFDGGPVARVVVTRDLSQAFDGIELATESLFQIEFAVMHNLAITATVRIEDPR